MVICWMRERIKLSYNWWINCFHSFALGLFLTHLVEVKYAQRKCNIIITRLHRRTGTNSSCGCAKRKGTMCSLIIAVFRVWAFITFFVLSAKFFIWNSIDAMHWKMTKNSVYRQKRNFYVKYPSVTICCWSTRTRNWIIVILDKS